MTVRCAWCSTPTDDDADVSHSICAEHLALLYPDDEVDVFEEGGK